MLRSRNLDDQSFEEIMEYAISRLPWLCPGWTDYNAHDPGITILELIAWYKEMQQYHMNVVTDELKKKLLKLLGVSPAMPRPAHCLLRLPQRSIGGYLPLTRVENEQEIIFELLEAAQPGPQVEALYVMGDQGVTDMTQIIAQPGISIWPFAGEKGKTELLIGLSGMQQEIRFWFEVDDKREVARNPFQSEDQAPRQLEWRCDGIASLLDVQDETHALSHSGFVTLELPQDFSPSDGGCGLPERYYVRVRQLDAGCEEEVRLCGVTTGCFRAAQQETWAKMRWFTVAPGPASLRLQDALSRDGGVYVFLREADGLRFVETQQQTDEAGRTLAFDAAGCVEDGDPNVLAVSQDQLRCGQLLFPATGLPDMAIDLALGGRQVLPDTLCLICDTLCEDGAIRPGVWNYVEDLSSSGPRDRAFSYDPLREQLLFGDGRHGAIPPRGKQGVLLASLALSYCGGGNVPENCGLYFADGSKADNTAAFGGRDAQSLADAATGFLHTLEHTQKCASEQDYERAAQGTPGLRVAAAKAIAGFDPEEPTGHSRIPVVTVVVLPWSAKPRPLPDQRFLHTVQAHLEQLRPICTTVKVIAPRYVPVGVSVQIKGKGGQLRQQVQHAIEEHLKVTAHGRSIGDAVVKDDLMAALMAVDGVLKVERIELRPLGPDCYAAPNGDLRFRRNAVAYLQTLDVQAR